MAITDIPITQEIDPWYTMDPEARGIRMQEAMQRTPVAQQEGGVAQPAAVDPMAGMSAAQTGLVSVLPTPLTAQLAPVAVEQLPMTPRTSNFKTSFARQAEGELQRPHGNITMDTDVENSALVQLTNFLRKHERFRAEAYPDFKQHSIGYGTKAASPDEKITVDEAERRMAEKAVDVIGAVKRVTPESILNEMTGAQIAALASLIYNVGEEGFKVNQKTGKPTRAYAALQAGDLDTFLIEAFDKKKGFVSAGGKQLAGLAGRRAAERRLWEKGIAA